MSSLQQTTSLHEPAGPTGNATRALLVIEGPGKSRLISLPAEGARILGRDPSVDINLRPSSVSRRHARLCFTPASASVTDLGSHNGTRVNGIRLSPKEVFQLTPGDILSVGDVCLVLQASQEDSPASGLVDGKTLEVGRHTVLLAERSMLRLYSQIERAGASSLAVLLHGETGTGKESCAAAIHHYSQRRGRPFVAINCANLQETLAESELFGHEHGAFTNAVAQKRGMLEEANGGTFFLDEIAELPMAVQAKLLRVLDNGIIRRIGGVKELPIDVRIVSATHKDLKAEVAAGRFREDLFYRLSVVLLHVPPLRQRLAEIPLLAQRFLDQACQRNKIPFKSLTAAAIDRLRIHSFPGNVRELKNLMEYVTAMISSQEVDKDDIEERLCLSAGVRSEQANLLDSPSNLDSCNSLRITALTSQYHRIQAEIIRAGGNKTKAAQNLGIAVRTMYSILDRYKRYYSNE